MVKMATMTLNNKTVKVKLVLERQLKTSEQEPNKLPKNHF
jgi:hypothetical protein